MQPSTPRPSAMSAASMTDAFASGDLTPVDVLEDVLEVAREAGEQFNAIAFMDEDAARGAAAESAARWAAGEQRGPLDGVPVSIKDSIPAAGTPWRHGSAVHEPIWATEDSAPAARLRDAGAVIFAKTAMPDLGMVASGLSSAYGTVRNPWNPEMSPGGSSSGAGVLVASGVGPLAVGTDLGGSVRIPAAHHGLFGFKPTQGRIPYAPASAVRTPGPLARSIDDMELLLAALAISDPSDLLALPGRYEPGAALESFTGLRVAVVRDAGSGMPTGDEEWAAVERLAGVMSDAGAELETMPDLGLVPEDQDAILATFRNRVLVEMDGAPLERWGRLIPELWEFVKPGYDLSALALGTAMARLDRAREQVRRATAGFDLILTPALSVAAFPAELAAPEGARSTIDHCQLTAWFNQTGQPAGVVPGGLTSAGMPIGVQLAGQRLDDARVVAAMRLASQLAGTSLDYPLLESHVTGAE
ncbi:amidase [Demequina sp. NBRC 110054]|uniref:amidase n=1 Tax=Demequina sp. NBRC 110054 TaxID=1570343 RepID=UPI0013565615|nr:amidase family protein [Demequina sp. NBRC 110054]